MAVLFFTACSTDPNNAKLKYLNSGEQYFKSGDYQAAIIQFRNALQVDPKYADAHYQLARTYLSLGKQDAALGEFQQTVALSPSNSDAQLELASLLVAHRKFDQAQTAISQVLKDGTRTTPRLTRLLVRNMPQRMTPHLRFSSSRKRSSLTRIRLRTTSTSGPSVSR